MQSARAQFYLKKENVKVNWNGRKRANTIGNTCM